MLGMRMVMTAIIGAEEGVNIVVNGAVAVSTNGEGGCSHF